jgi:hypothetical protein
MLNFFDFGGGGGGGGGGVFTGSHGEWEREVGVEIGWEERG